MNLEKNGNVQGSPVRPQQGGNQRQVNTQQMNYQQQINPQQNMPGSQVPNMNYNNGYVQTQNTEYEQSDYSQSMYNQQMGSQPKKQPVSYNNILDKTGKFGLNLMIYVLVGCLLFMCNLTTVLIILFAIAFIMEKDNGLTKVLATLLVISLTISVGYNVIYALTTPFSRLGYSIMEQASYGNFLYKFGDFISSGLNSIRNILSWIVDVAFIVIGAIEFNNIRKGKFRAPKFISKYFD